MKTGKSLPKVYSAQEIERMFEAVENEKHCLVLMMRLDAVCGLVKFRILSRKILLGTDRSSELQERDQKTGKLCLIPI